MTTGMMLPRWCSVAALYALTNSMMLTPCWPRAGPTGGAGVAAPAWICRLMNPETFLLLGGMVFLRGGGGPTPWAMTPLQCPRDPEEGLLRSDLGDLAEGELDRGLPAEDGDEHLELLGVRVDLGDGRREGLERAVHDGDRLADLEVDDGGLALPAGGTGLATGGALGTRGGLEVGRLDHAVDLVEGERHRLVGVADEPGDPGGVAHGAPRLVGEVHAHQDVPGHPDPAHQLALAALDLGDLFHRHLDLEDVLLHVQGGDPGLEVGLDAVLVTRVGVHDVPVAELARQVVLERLDRVDGLEQVAVLVGRQGELVVGVGGGLVRGDGLVRVGLV